jgi:hypothetical protein
MAKEEKLLTWCYCESSDEIFNILVEKGYKYRGRKRGDLFKIFFEGEFGSISEDMLTGTEVPFFIKDGEFIMGVLDQ